MALYKICRGPRFGQTIHLPQSQEVNLAVQLGDLEPVPDVDLQRAHGNLAQEHPPYGWSVWRQITSEGDVKFFICFSDGMGGRTLYDKEPGPKRVWRYHPESGREGYETEPSDCPQSVIDEFFRLTGGNVDPQWAADQRQRQIFELEAEQKKQDKWQSVVIRTGVVK
jgi:hypothetical protein